MQRIIKRLGPLNPITIFYCVFQALLLLITLRVFSDDKSREIFYVSVSSLAFVTILYWNYKKRKQIDLDVNVKVEVTSTKEYKYAFDKFDEFDEEINSGSGEAWTCFRNAHNLVKDGKFKEAIGSYDQALRLFEDEHKQSESDDGIKEKINSAICRIYLERGLACVKSGDMLGGVDNLDEAFKRAPVALIRASSSEQSTS
jgi:tetratricopeptide (TPR) repeat protein